MEKVLKPEIKIGVPFMVPDLIMFCKKRT